MWSSEEEQIVKECISEHANNLSLAFEIASEKIGKSPKAVSLRYYKVIRNKSNITALITNRGCSINLKNSVRREPDLVLETMSFLIPRLKKSDKLVLIKLLFS